MALPEGKVCIVLTWPLQELIILPVFGCWMCENVVSKSCSELVGKVYLFGQTDTSHFICLPADPREPNFLWHRKLSLQLTRASPSKGNIREIDQHAENSKEKDRLVSAQGVDNQLPGIHEDDSDNPNALRHADAEVDASMDVGSSLKNEMQTTENKEEEGSLGDTALKGSIFAGLLLIGVVGGFGAASYIYREQINAFLLEFSDFIEGIASTCLLFFCQE